MGQTLDARLSQLLDTGHTIILSTGGEALEGDADAPIPTWWRADVTIRNSDDAVLINVVGDSPSEALAEAVTALTQRYTSAAKEPAVELAGRLISTWEGQQRVTELASVDADYFKKHDGAWTVTGWTLPESAAPAGSRRRDLRLELTDGTVLEGVGYVESIRTRPIDADPHPRRVVIHIYE